MDAAQGMQNLGYAGSRTLRSAEHLCHKASLHVISIVCGLQQCNANCLVFMHRCVVLLRQASAALIVMIQTLPAGSMPGLHLLAKFIQQCSCR